VKSQKVAFFFEMKRQFEIDKPEEFNTFYPSDKELAWLQENFYLDELNERYKDRTSENIIKDILARYKTIPSRLEQLNGNLLREIAIRCDIRHILQLAQKIPLFLMIISDDTFWHSKFIYDFPKVVEMMPYEYPPVRERLTMDEAQLFLQEGYQLQVRKRMYPDHPWRRLYNVVRKIVNDFKTDIVPRVQFNYNFSFKAEYHRDCDCVSLHSEITVTTAPFFAFEKKYLQGNMFLYSQGSGIYDSIRLLISFWRGVGGDIPYQRAFELMVYRGYAKKNDQGVVMIGCAQCGESAKYACESCVSEAVYCSAKCQTVHWQTHKDSHQKL
jgi:hypothetical protein